MRWPWQVYRDYKRRKAEREAELEKWRKQDAITLAYVRRKVAEMEHQEMIRRAVDEVMRHR